MDAEIMFRVVFSDDGRATSSVETFHYYQLLFLMVVVQAAARAVAL